MTHITRYWIMASFVLLLAACGGSDSGGISVPGVSVPGIPTATRDPLRFYAPTPVPPASQRNPLTIVYAPPQPTNENVSSSLESLTAALVNQSGLAIRATSVERDVDVLTRVCDFSNGDQVSAGWMRGTSAVMATVSGCGDVLLFATRDERAFLRMDIVGARGVGSLSALQRRDFCRLDVTDFYSWGLPVLAMEASRVDPTAINSVSDFDSYAAIFAAIDAGECYATGAPAGLIDTETYSEIRPSLATSYESPPMPYAVLVVPPTLSQQDRETLQQAYVSLLSEQPVALPTTESTEEAESPEPDSAEQPNPLTRDPLYVEIDPASLLTQQQAMYWLTGADGVVAATNDDLLPIRELMESTNINLDVFNR